MFFACLFVSIPRRDYTSGRYRILTLLFTHILRVIVVVRWYETVTVLSRTIQERS